MTGAIYTCMICQTTAAKDLSEEIKMFNCDNCGEPFESVFLNGFPFVRHADAELRAEVAEAYSGYVKWKSENYGPVTEGKRKIWEEKQKDI
jgi:hypothetical protein